MGVQVPSDTNRGTQPTTREPLTLPPQPRPSSGRCLRARASHQVRQRGPPPEPAPLSPGLRTAHSRALRAVRLQAARTGLGLFGAIAERQSRRPDVAGSQATPSRNGRIVGGSCPRDTPPSLTNLEGRGTRPAPSGGIRGLHQPLVQDLAVCRTSSAAPRRGIQSIRTDPTREHTATGSSSHMARLLGPLPPCAQSRTDSATPRPSRMMWMNRAEGNNACS